MFSVLKYGWIRNELKLDGKLCLKSFIFDEADYWNPNEHKLASNWNHLGIEINWSNQIVCSRFVALTWIYLSSSGPRPRPKKKLLYGHCTALNKGMRYLCKKKKLFCLWTFVASFFTEVAPFIIEIDSMRKNFQIPPPSVFLGPPPASPLNRRAR